MHYALTLAGLATMAAAAPMMMSGDNWYASYAPYASYNLYSAAAEAEAMTNGKTKPENQY